MVKKIEISQIQEQFWIIQNLYPDTSAYNIPAVLKIEGDLNPDALQNAIKQVVLRHEMLRTRFYEQNEKVYQEVADVTQIMTNIEIVNFHVPFTENPLPEQILQEVNRPFNLTKSPLFRIKLFTFTNNISVLTIVFHHIIIDLYSLKVFTREFSELYNSYSTGDSHILIEPVNNYSDYSTFLKDWLSSEKGMKKTGEWKEDIPQKPDKLEFPTDFTRPKINNLEGKRKHFILDTATSSEISEFALKNSVNDFTVLLAAYATLLYRLSNQPGIVIGVPFANRKNVEFRETFGCFVNILPISVDFTESLTVEGLLMQVFQSLLKAHNKQEVPFLLLNSTLVQNDSAGLFQAGFTFEPPMQLDLQGVEVVPLVVEREGSQLELFFTLWDENEKYNAYVQYSSNCFKKETIEHIWKIYCTTLNSLISDPLLLINKISITPQEDLQFIFEFNKTELSFPEYLVQDFFEIQSKLNPSKTALISEKISLTYNELNNKANQLARHLISLGVSNGAIVGICLERSAEMVISVLAVLKAGCCYLPMDPTFPDDRINYMFEDSNARVLISQNSLKEKFNRFTDKPIVLLDIEKEKISKYSTLKPELSIDPQSLAYIIYTSGSTGTPKGVKVHHQAVVNFLNSMIKRPGFTGKDRLLAVTTLSFDISVLELFLPLSTGGELIIAATRDISDGQTLAGLLDLHDITVMQATPATWNILLSSEWKGKKNLKALCGGEAVMPGLVKDLLTKVESLWNMYGPTETTVWSTCNQLTDYNPPILVGTPIDNTSIYILDKNNNQLPVGIPGEVCIGGLGVTKGYHNRPELTAEKFIPFENHKIIYKTGDSGRILRDGNIELFGRLDNQIKLRGFRIEPGEIESLLSQLPNIKEAVVKVHRFDQNDERLVAFLNVETEFKLTREEITGSLEQHLPSFMIPSFFQTSEGFPRLPNGKINKKALLFEIAESARRDEIDFESLTETQKKLIIIWEDILKIKNISPSDNFFEIGGTSLLAIRIINRVKEELGYTLTFRELIPNSTINQLGSLTESQPRSSAKKIELVHSTKTTNLPLSINQKRIWVISKLQPDIPSYIIPYTYELLGNLDREIFQKSLDILFRRHHVVFSTVKEINGEPYFDIVPTEVKVSFIDYSGLAENEKEKKINEIINSDYGKVFDLKNGPLYRLYLIMTGTNEYYFHLSIHHIIFDAWSWSVLVNDFSEIYNSLVKGEEISLEKIEFQQYDYAKWEENSANFKNENELIAFWKENLKEASPILRFPYDFPRKEQKSGKGSYESIQLSQDLSGKLRKISKDENTSLFATMLSTFGILMHKYSGEDDINIGLPVTYRPHSKLEKIFGMFVNTVVVRLKFEKNFTFKSLIQLTKEAAFKAINNQDLPFEKIVEIVNPERSSNVNPLFQVGFVWQNSLNIPMELEGIKSKRISEVERTSIFDITLYLWEDGDHIEGELEYNIDLLKQETIIRLRDNLIHLLQSIVENPDTIVDSLPSVTNSEANKILGFSGTRINYPEHKTLIELLDEQLSLYPDKPAVIFKGETLTYKQLSLKTNQLGNSLREMGVGRNTPVGILAEKSLDVIVGIIGILKAGGAYVPIDPDYPKPRIDFIINDSGCRFLLTQEKFMMLPVENVLKLNLNSPETFHKNQHNIENINTSSDLAYIMYTSGTTGKPKGSMIKQNGIVRLVRDTNYIDMTSNDRILLTSAIVFDVATFEIWGALLNGGSLYIAEKETILNPKALGEDLDKNDITILWLTSALFTHIAESRADIFGKLKYLLVGGDVLSAPHINKVRKANPGLKVINGYGPTENTTFSTTYLIEKDFDYSIPIGKPISNSTAYIFDRNMNYQPIGVIGELYVGGDGVSLGYLNRDDLNKNSFIDHPFIKGERLYKTGDYAKWFPDGNIEFHGRVDNQLKIRGFRVELEEIESVISEIDGVIETVIKPVKVGEGDYMLIAFLNVPGTFKMDSNEIGKRIKTKLPSYMVPSAYKFMQGFPRTINDKIDRKALTFDLTELKSKKSEEVTTLTPTEKIIHKIWSLALKTEDISVTDNFFDIGGNSLMSISVFAKIESAFNVELGLRVFFDSPRISDLAELIDIALKKPIDHKPADRKNESKPTMVKGEI